MKSDYGWPSQTEHDHKPIKKQVSLHLRLTVFEDGSVVTYPQPDDDLTMSEVLFLMAAYLRQCAEDATYKSIDEPARNPLYFYLGRLSDIALSSRLKDEQHDEA